MTGTLSQSVVLVGTAVRWKFGEFGRSFGFLAKEGSDVQAGFDGGAGEEAVVTDPGEAFGEDMKEPAADQFMDAEGDDSGALSAEATLMAVQMLALVM